MQMVRPNEQTHAARIVQSSGPMLRTMIPRVNIRRRRKTPAMATKAILVMDDWSPRDALIKSSEKPDVVASLESSMMAVWL